MREIISLQVGGAGNKIGERFFETLCAEHRVSPTTGTLPPREVHDFASRAHSDAHHEVANSAGAGEPVEGAAAASARRGGGKIHRRHSANSTSTTSTVNNSNNNVEAEDGSFSFFPNREVESTSIPTAARTVTTPRRPHSPPGGGAIHSAAAARMSRRALDVYFSQGKRGRWVPRSVLVDLEPSVVDDIRGGAKMGKLFRPDGVVLSRGGRGGGNNWARGYHGEGTALVEEAMDAVRREAEECESLQGFQIVHALGGGTGSGMGSLLIQHLVDDYPDRINLSFPVFPSPKTSDVVTEPYNAVLSLPSLIENCDLAMTLDNEALHNICARYKASSDATTALGDLNRLVAEVMSGVTASLRFSGQLNSDLRKLAVNLIPFPRLHFLMVGQSPVLSVDEYTSSDVKHLVKEMTSPQNMMVNCDPRTGRYLTASAIFRGADLSTQEVEAALRWLQYKGSAHFVDWLPDNLQAAVCNVPPVSPPGVETSATFIGNSTAIGGVLQRVLAQATTMLSRGAFIHSYYAEGMEQGELREALNLCFDLGAEYQQYSSACSNHGRRATSSSSSSEEEEEEAEKEEKEEAGERSGMNLNDGPFDFPERQGMNAEDADKRRDVDEGYEEDADDNVDAEAEGGGGGGVGGRGDKKGAGLKESGGGAELHRSEGVTQTRSSDGLLQQNGEDDGSGERKA